MAVERKSSIRKAPAADVVDVLTATAIESREFRSEGMQPLEVSQKEAGSVVSARGPGPGRPRSKRRMEPFSSKIEMELRDELDAYIRDSGITIIEFLDEAIRDRLGK